MENHRKHVESYGKPRKTCRKLWKVMENIWKVVEYGKHVESYGIWNIYGKLWNMENMWKVMEYGKQVENMEYGKLMTMILMIFCDITTMGLYVYSCMDVCM